MTLLIEIPLTEQQKKETDLKTKFQSLAPSLSLKKKKRLHGW